MSYIFIPHLRIYENLPLVRHLTRYEYLLAKQSKPTMPYQSKRDGNLIEVGITEDNYSEWGFSTTKDYFNQLVDEILNDQAKSLGYDSMERLMVYRDSASYQAQVSQFSRYCGGVWDVAIPIYEEIEAGNRSFPKKEELEAELPTYDSFEEV